MTYATVTDVRRLNPTRTISEQSKPSTADVSGFLEDTAAEIAGILHGRGYVTPIDPSSPAAYRLVRRYNAIGGHALAERAAPTSREGSTEAAEDAWEAARKMLREGRIELPDAPRQTGSGRAGAAPAREPWFTTGMRF